MTKRLFVVAMAMAAVCMCSLSAIAQDLSTGRGVIKAHLEATGGIEAWKAVDDLYVEASIEVDTPMGDLVIGLKSWSIFPGYGYTQMSLTSGPDGIPPEAVSMKAYFTPLQGWMESAQGRQDLDDVSPHMKQQFIRSSAKTELNYLAYHDSLLVLQADSTFDGHDVYVVAVTSLEFESEIKLMIDKESLLILAQHTQTPMGAATTVLGEYFEVSGLLFTSSQTTESTQQNAALTFDKIEVDTGITPSQLATKSGSGGVATPE